VGIIVIIVAVIQQQGIIAAAVIIKFLECFAIDDVVVPIRLKYSHVHFEQPISYPGITADAIDVITIIIIVVLAREDPKTTTAKPVNL